MTRVVFVHVSCERSIRTKRLCARRATCGVVSATRCARNLDFSQANEREMTVYVEERRSHSVIASSRVLFCVRISSQSKTGTVGLSTSCSASSSVAFLHPAARPHSTRAVAFLAYESSPSLLNPKRKYDKRTRKPTKRMTKRHVTTSRISCTGRRPRRRGRSAWSATVNLGGAYDTAGGRRAREKKKIDISTGE